MLHILRNVKNETMKYSPSNPFLLAGYHSPEYFCNRNEEYKKLEEAIQNERNVTLYSIRRLGKTALIRHLFYYLNKDKRYTTIYTDILPTESLQDVTQKLATAVMYKYGDISKRGFTKKIQEFIKSIGATFEFDPLTGTPSLKLQYQNQSKIKASLENILYYLADQKQSVVITLDEFQQITRFQEENPEAYLRSLVQEYPQIRFIFSGSHRKIMMSMFTSHGKPFYRSTQLLELKPINKKEYSTFIKRHFKKAGKIITQPVIDKIFQWTRLQTYYVQLVCNKLYALSGQLSEEKLDETFVQILQEEENVFSNYRNLLTTTQWKVLTALAKEGTVKEPTSGKFLKKYDISSASTMNTTLKALENKELIIRINDEYTLHDTLLMRWIQYYVG